jgi:hypothetical protein
MSVGMGLETRVHCLNVVICQTRVVIIIMVILIGLNYMLTVASAYSGLLDLCLYFYSLCFILSCSVVTPPNLVVVGGVTT